jgi:hypothetical protein
MQFFDTVWKLKRQLYPLLIIFCNLGKRRKGVELSELQNTSTVDIFSIASKGVEL